MERGTILDWIKAYNKDRLKGLKTNKGGRPEGNPVPIKDAPGLIINQTVFQGAENLVVPTEEEIMVTAKSLKDFTRMHKIVAQKHPGLAASYQILLMEVQENRILF